MVVVGGGGVRKREGLATVATSLQLEFKAIVVDYGFNSRLRTWTSCSLVVISIKLVANDELGSRCLKG